jgi:hypothetical protein
MMQFTMCCNLSRFVHPTIAEHACWDFMPLPTISSTMGTTSGAGTAYFSSVCVGFVLLNIYVFCVVFCRSLFSVFYFFFLLFVITFSDIHSTSTCRFFIVNINASINM